MKIIWGVLQISLFLTLTLVLEQGILELQIWPKLVNFYVFGPNLAFYNLQVCLNELLAIYLLIAFFGKIMADQSQKQLYFTMLFSKNILTWWNMTKIDKIPKRDWGWFFIECYNRFSRLKMSESNLRNMRFRFLLLW